MSLRKATNAEKRYRTKIGGGRSMHEEDVFEKTNNHCPFDSLSEQALWEFFDKTPMTLPLKEGESSIGKKKLPRPEVGDDDVLSLELNMEGFESDSEDEHRPRKTRVTERDILQEQFRLCRDRRRFFEKLIHTLKVFNDYISRQQLNSKGSQATLKKSRLQPLIPIWENPCLLASHSFE